MPSRDDLRTILAAAAESGRTSNTILLAALELASSHLDRALDPEALGDNKRIQTVIQRYKRRHNLQPASPQPSLSAAEIAAGMEAIKNAIKS